ncbi:unnamed protein product, partial [Darwinula stevensoni]
VDLQIPSGKLVAVVGQVGSGKSSLLSAFLGDMEKVSGLVNVDGEVAYVSQEAWIRNAPIKDNILFGKAYDEAFYLDIMSACALEEDLATFPAGDMTEIGEKGINLSGGQKQRVSLARAVYSDADVFFMDDPLSAVDSHVGKHLFQQVIGPRGLLKKKFLFTQTRVLVTHGISHLPQMDLIIMMKDGKIVETGTYRKLVQGKGAFSNFVLQFLSEEEGDDSEGLSMMPPPFYNGRLIEEEMAEKGRVKWRVYAYFLKSMGLHLSLVSIFMYGISEGFLMGSNMALSRWADEASLNRSMEASQRDAHIGVYTALGVCYAGTFALASVMLWTLVCVAGRKLHRNCLQNILRNPLKFFDTTPTGRILNRFSQDISSVDEGITQPMEDGVSCAFEVICAVMVIAYNFPWFLVAVVPIFTVYYLAQNMYVSTARQLRRLEAISRSPIYSHFGETVAGISSIRAYRRERQFIRESEEGVDNNNKCQYPLITSLSWLRVRLEALGGIITFVASILAVFGRDSLSPALAGLCITYAMSLSKPFNWLARMMAEVETSIVGVERIKEYCETPVEAPWEIPEKKPKDGWPQEGTISFRDYQTRYREGLELVLKGISIDIKGGEKVGVVGRTGAGKTSLMLGLFRVIEKAGGEVRIDGIDISQMGLHDLRSNLTIIPQDPVLFSGSLRANLDPFEKHTDDEIWRALELSHLKAFAKELPQGLQHPVAEGGQNLSFGQRQLICLARALLRKSKILVLDEATASVDLETDELIQQTIRREFKSCTVLTIAHRINTIMDYDRVLVLDGGEIREFDSPTNLLRDSESMFLALTRDAGIS